MTASRAPSHPTSAVGIIGVTQELPCGAAHDSEDAFRSSTAVVVVGGIDGRNHRNIAVKITAFTSHANALAPDRLYSASLRLVKPQGADQYTGYFTPKQPFNIGRCESVTGIVNNVTMSGLGVVVSREGVTSGDEGHPMLTTTIRHTDWDDETQETVSFDVTYVTPTIGELESSICLFEVGNELHLSGLIVDWDDLKKTWIVQTDLVSITTGHQMIDDSNTVVVGLPGGSFAMNM